MIIKIKGNWLDVVDDCRNTVGKPPLGKEPSTEFKRSILIAEHSPIRSISFRWKWNGIKSWVATHWARHKWECFIQTQRKDRTGVNRDESPQGAAVDFVGDANVQQLIDTMRKRLCGQASPETRRLAVDLKEEIHTIEPEISNVLVPNCIYRCGCPELSSCPKWKVFTQIAQEHGTDITDIQARYNLYNYWFFKGDQENQ